MTCPGCDEDGQYRVREAHTEQNSHTHQKSYIPEVLVHNREIPSMCAAGSPHARQKPVFTGTTGSPHGAPSAGLAPSTA